ncbi:MAG: LysR family transcriptional regulator [Rhodospirillales bacterium]|nr:LysR family transcriptional regulator [Rhodospirillales bacterium]MDH3967972.1 LysR family transcriptional regulator [Rhodospirillales bacterium]
MQSLNWNDLRFVLAVARTRSLAGAARRLGVNDTTVARRIAQAEQRLGAHLFERNLGILHPTEAGAAVVAGAERVELEVQALESAVSGADGLAAGSVRVTSVPIMVNRVLVPALPRLLRNHPQLRVELIAEPRDLSLTKREADIALRLARPRTEGRAIARRIGQLDFAVYEPSRKGTEPLPWITYDDTMADLPQGRWIAERAIRDRQAPPQVMVNDAEAIFQSVKAGLGRSLLPTFVGDREPGLARHSDAPAPLSRELWLMVHPELRELARIRVVMDWLVSVIDQIRGGRI